MDRSSPRPAQRHRQSSMLQPRPSPPCSCSAPISASRAPRCVAQVVARDRRRVPIAPLYSVLALAAFASGLVSAWGRAFPVLPLWVRAPTVRHLAADVDAAGVPAGDLCGDGTQSDRGRPASRSRRGLAPGHRHHPRHAPSLHVGSRLVGAAPPRGQRRRGVGDPVRHLAVLALVGTLLIDRRRTRENAPGWGVFLQATSNLPFAAIVERRQRSKSRRDRPLAPRARARPLCRSVLAPTRVCSGSLRWDEGAVASSPSAIHYPEPARDLQD